MSNSPSNDKGDAVTQSDARTPREIINTLDAEWRDIAAKTLGDGAELISASRFIPDSRVYATDDKVAKIRRVESGHEYNHLSSASAIQKELGREVEYHVEGPWEIAVEKRVPGNAFSNHLMEQQDTKFGRSQRRATLKKVRTAVKELHKKGISHGDLRADNVILVGDRVELIDFDLSAKTSRLGAAYRDWVGVGLKGVPFPYWKLSLFTQFPKVETVGRRLKAKVKKPAPVLGAGVSADLGSLDRAWVLAQGSAANARGQNLAYYALTYKGQHFSGERAWYPRWEAIRSSVDFTGKSMLELGCNMGLLSTYAMLEGAASAHGVDHDPDIVAAANELSKGLDAGSTFAHLDLMGSATWEDELGGRDIVTALSVVHWLPNKERVLDFLGKHDELIYEGHDTLDIETARLNAIGFTKIDVIMNTERDRQVLHARKG